MPRPLVYLIYNLLLPLLLLLGFPSFLVKGLRRGGLSRNFRQRLGLFRPETVERLRGKHPVWIHAVSVGEVFIALKIIEAIQAKAPEMHLVLSTTTTTGFRVAEEKACDTLTVIHNPVDLPWVTRSAIRKLSPSRLVLVEAEVWPNLVSQLKRLGTPVYLVNARLSPRSERRYLKCLPLIEPVFSLLDGVTVPFEIDRDRWAGLGIPKERIEVLGSVKFDHAASTDRQDTLVTELQTWLANTGLPEGSRILLGGSTHDGEENMLAHLAAKLRHQFPNLALVLVPRHAERGGEIASYLRGEGFDPVLRQGATISETGATAGMRVWIANTTGELRAWYRLAEAVVVGKSFHGEGGQNPVEPILAGKPVVVGPHMQNFADVIADLLAVGGILQVPDETALAEGIRKLFAEPAAGKVMAERGVKAIGRHSGATERTVAYLLDR